MSLGVPAIPSPYIHSSQKRRKNIWYSVKDGEWSDPSTWISNGLSYCQYNFNYPGQAVPSPIFPAIGDDVYINHTVNFNFPGTNTSLTVNNLYISGKLTTVSPQANTINIIGDLQSTGSIDLTCVSGMTLVLYGTDNYVNSFVGGTNSTVTYARLGDQMVMALPYVTLTIIGTGTKYATGDLNITKLSIPITTTLLTFELGIYNLSVSSTSVIGSKLSKTGGGSLLFTGLLTFSNTFTNSVLSLTGNPNVECRGGISSINNATSLWYAGTGTWSFTTNNQTITQNGNSQLVFNGQVLIAAGITLSITSLGTPDAEYVRFNDLVVAGSSSSTLTNNGNIWISNPTMPMSTGGGVFNYMNGASSYLGFPQTSAYTLPYTSFQGLYIVGTGIKTLSGDSVVGKLWVATGAQIEASSYNLQIAGTSNLGGLLSKNGSGNVLFVGLITLSNSIPGIDFSSGNPTVECRGGITYINQSYPTFKSGTGTWTFSTNNQTVSGLGLGMEFDGNVLISGAITLIFSGNIFTTNSIINGSLNGDNAGSVFDNRVANTLNTFGIAYTSSVRPMITGSLVCNTSASVWKYNALGNQDVTGGTYRTLEFGGSGVKTLQGNVVVNTTAGGSWSITGTATINYNGFTITTI